MGQAARANPRLLDAEEKLTAAIRAQRQLGSKLIEWLNRRDSYRDALGRRRPHWCDDGAQWLEYQRRLRSDLADAERHVERCEAELTRGAETMAEWDRHIEALTRVLGANGASAESRRNRQRHLWRG